MMTKPRTIVIACQGTRGDVQPYCGLAIELRRKGWGVVLGAPPEFRSFVSGYKIHFEDIGDSPTHTMYKQSVSKDGKGSLASYQQAVQLFNPPGDKEPFTITWFRRIFALVKTHKPDVLMLVFTSWSGAACIPQLLGLPTKVILSYPMPLTPTKEFSVTMAGTGFTMPFGFLNKLQWTISERMIVQRIHLKAAQRNVTTVIAEQDAAGHPLPGSSVVDMAKLLDPLTLPTIFCYSPTLLPRPHDWPVNHYVVGQFKLPKKPDTDHKPLPAKLQDQLNIWRNQGKHIIYFGFGSLSFFEPSKVTQIFDDVATAVTELAKTMPVRGVIQTTLSSTPGKTGSISAATASKDMTNAPFITFSESVDHSLLFPQVSCVMSHGGVGTVQAALNAGKPVISMCCLPSADQSFWADIAHKRELGPRWFWVDQCSVTKVVEAVKEAIVNLDKYTKNAEIMAEKFALEDGVKKAVEILEDQRQLYQEDLEEQKQRIETGNDDLSTTSQVEPPVSPSEVVIPSEIQDNASSDGNNNVDPTAAIGTTRTAMDEQIDEDRDQIRRKAAILIEIMQAGDKIEEVISQHQSEIDKLMLHLLDRRIQTAKDLENEQPQIVQGLTLLYKRLKAEFDRQQASASLRLLDDILNILDSPSDAESQSIATLKEERTAQAIARLRLAFGDGDVAVSNILSIAAKIAQEGAEAADMLVGEEVDVDTFITDITNLLDNAIQQQQQLEQYLDQMDESRPERGQVKELMENRQRSIGLVEEVLSLSNMLKTEARNKILF